MDKLISKLFFENWQRKIVALVTALIVWLFVNSSISETKTIPNVPIRITNLPTDKTIAGLLSNRMLTKRVSLSLTGSKDVIQEIEPGDLEVSLDVSTAPSDEWVVQINKKNLVSLNPGIDLLHHISNVSHNEFVLKLSPLITAKIPITILPPTGQAPNGYEYLDVWPQQLTQTVSGPQEEIQALRLAGLEVTFNLSDISKADLDALKTSQTHEDELSFPVPEKWQKVVIPFRNNVLDEINDPEAPYLHIDFLRKQYLPIEKEIPIRVFYPLKFSDTINAKTFPLVPNEQMRVKNDITLLTVPLFLRNVSDLFLNLISENIEIVIVAAPETERDVLQWSLEVIDAHEIEDVYVAFFHANYSSNKNSSAPFPKEREIMLRTRFREYLHRLGPYKAPDQKFRLESKLSKNSIVVSPVK